MAAATSSAQAAAQGWQPAAGGAGGAQHLPPGTGIAYMVTVTTAVCLVTPLQRAHGMCPYSGVTFNIHTLRWIQA